MAPNPPGSGRRRIAGDAARRRRDTAGEPDAEAVEEATGAATTSPESEESPAESSTEADAGPATTMDAATEAPAEVRKRSRLLAPPPRESGWWLGALAVVTIAALVFVAVVGFRYLGERSDDQAFVDGRDDATSAAATSAETILSYSYQSLDDDRAAAEKAMTDDFAKEYGELYTKPYCEAFPVQGDCTVEGSFPQVVERNKQQTEASAVDVAPMECGDECSDTKASVLMFIDQTSTSNGDQQDPIGNRAVFSMVKQNGDWLVDGIRYV
ncbi:hypothetical protein [Solicola gregarius]|uniref:Mce-associated membrane protein n=1 Tax=Solicola gregarius TaxID=2908642 RepID=A0AA46YJP7_9ACTN|nr:hypothetical protein [Solicola gregarius]UYM03731.1 hypothetical protein L0C25_14405 [Solicola gregarius]